MTAEASFTFAFSTLGKVRTLRYELTVQVTEQRQGLFIWRQRAAGLPPSLLDTAGCPAGACLDSLQDVTLAFM